MTSWNPLYFNFVIAYQVESFLSKCDNRLLEMVQVKKITLNEFE